jgi:hypothetical protein
MHDVDRVVDVQYHRPGRLRVAPAPNIDECVDAKGFQRDVISGKSAAEVRTKKRGRAIVTGGKGTAAPARTMGLLGGIFSYAVEEGYRADNPVNGVIRPKDGTREWRLDDAGSGQLGKCLAKQMASIGSVYSQAGCRQ